MLLKGCLVSQSVKYERGKHMMIMIQFSYTPCRDTAICTGCGISLSYTPCRDTAISTGCGISLSYTPCRDTAISPGVGYLNPPSAPVALGPMLSHKLLSYDKTTTQLYKLPLSTIIFRTTDNTNVFLITTKIVFKKYNTSVQYVSIVTASNETLTFYFRF